MKDYSQFKFRLNIHNIINLLITKVLDVNRNCFIKRNLSCICFCGLTQRPWFFVTLIQAITMHQVESVLLSKVFKIDSCLRFNWCKFSMEMSSRWAWCLQLSFMAKIWANAYMLVLVRLNLKILVIRSCFELKNDVIFIIRSNIL